MASAPSIIKLISADGLEREKPHFSWEDPPRTIRTAVDVSSRRFDINLPLSAMAQSLSTRVYELVEILRSPSMVTTFIYREKLCEPAPPPPQASPELLARALFDEEHRFEAMRWAEFKDRGDEKRVTAVLDKMWGRLSIKCDPTCSAHARLLRSRKLQPGGDTAAHDRAGLAKSGSESTGPYTIGRSAHVTWSFDTLDHVDSLSRSARTSTL